MSTTTFTTPFVSTTTPTTATNKKASVFQPLSESTDTTLKQMQLKQKILSGPSSNAHSVTRKEFNRKKTEEDDGKVNKSEYYKFYLNNA